MFEILRSAGVGIRRGGSDSSSPVLAMPLFSDLYYILYLEGHNTQ